MYEVYDWWGHKLPHQLFLPPFRCVPRCVPDPIISVPSAGGDLLLLVEVAHLCEESVILYRMKKVKCSEKNDINFLVATQRESMKLTRNY